jgi:serine/threonine protein kinase
VVYEICALVPPFRAENMDGLYKRVLKGQFSRIPKVYSDELNHVIKKLLNVNAQGRPTCDQILSSQVIQKKMKKYGLLDKIPSVFKKKNNLAEIGTEKNSTATGGEASESEFPDVHIEYEGARKQDLMNTI